MFTPPWGNCNKWYSMVVSYVKGLAMLGLSHQIHHPWVFFSSLVIWRFFKWHIIFEFFTQNPLKSRWWNWLLCLKRLLKPRVYVLCHASHSPKVSWTFTKSFIGFFSFYNFNKIIDKVYFIYTCSKGHKIGPREPIWSWGCSFFYPEPPLNP